MDPTSSVAIGVVNLSQEWGFVGGQPKGQKQFLLELGKLLLKPEARKHSGSSLLWEVIL